MKNLRRLDVILALAFSSLLLVLSTTSCSSSEKHSPIIEPIAKAYGIDSYDKVDALRYTFNLDFPLGHVSRAWVWEPKTNTVSFEGKDQDGNPVKVTYQRSQVATQSDTVKNMVDPAFVNDNYWILFPFHAYWDSSAEVTDKGMQNLPKGTGSARLVSVKYAGGGYTPGDTWNLFVGSDNRIQQLLFQHGGDAKPHVVIATWDGYKMAGPFVVSTDHVGTADGGPLHLFFSDVAVKVASSDSWVNAQ